MRWWGCVAYWWRTVNPIDNPEHDRAQLSKCTECKMIMWDIQKAQSQTLHQLVLLSEWSPVTRRTAQRRPPLPIWVSFHNPFAYKGQDQCADQSLWREPDQNVLSHEPDASSTSFESMTACFYFRPSMKHEGFLCCYKKEISEWSHRSFFYKHSSSCWRLLQLSAAEDWLHTRQSAKESTRPDHTSLSFSLINFIHSFGQQ